MVFTNNRAVPNYKNSHPLVVTLRLSLHPDRTLGEHIRKWRLEILAATEESMAREVYRPRFRELFPNREELRASWAPIFRGSGIGFLIGLLLRSAHILASFVSYITEKRLAKRPEEFGTGRIEGVAGPETANLVQHLFQFLIAVHGNRYPIS